MKNRTEKHVNKLIQNHVESRVKSCAENYMGNYIKSSMGESCKKLYGKKKPSCRTMWGTVKMGSPRR